MLEFAALTILRVREPNLLRPFRMPGGTAATILAALGPLALLLLALIESRTETIAGISALPIGIGVAFGGFIAYFLWARSQPYQAPA